MRALTRPQCVIARNSVTCLLFQGVSKEGLPIQSEFIVMVVALLVWWGANSIKAKISE